MSVNEKMTAIADNIRAKTGDTEPLTLDGMAESIPKVYFAGQSSMVDPDKIIPKTVSDSYISVDDVSEIPHSVGCRVESVNLFDCLNAQKAPENLYGNDVDEIADRTKDSITIRKTNDENWTFVEFALPDGLEGKKITIYGEWTTSGDNTGMIRVNWDTQLAGSEIIAQINTSGLSASGIVTEKPSNASHLALLLYGGKTGSTGDEVYYKNIMVTAGDWSGVFTPYVSPESVSVKRCGKNLIPYPFNYWHVNDAGITAEDMGDGGIVINGTATGEAYVNFFYNTYLPINCNLSYGVPNGGFVANKYSDSISVEYADRNKFGYIYIKSGTVCDNVIVYPQIEVGSTATEYEPYNGQTLTPNADGAVEGMTSVSPHMNIFTNTEGVNIEATYNKSYGMQQSDDFWWQTIIGDGTKEYKSLFQSSDWTHKEFNPPSVLSSTYMHYMFYKAKGIRHIKKEHIDTSKALSMNYMFANSDVEEIDEIVFSEGKDGAYLVSGCGSLHTIGLLKLRDDGLALNTTSSPFNACSKLANIAVAGVIGYSLSFQWCPLTAASITSIINALSDTVTGQTLTLNLTAVNTAFETSSGAADGSTSAEFAALVATKTNWTITMI